VTFSHRDITVVGPAILSLAHARAAHRITETVARPPEFPERSDG